MTATRTTMTRTHLKSSVLIIRLHADQLQQKASRGSNPAEVRRQDEDQSEEEDQGSKETQGDEKKHRVKVKG